MRKVGAFLTTALATCFYLSYLPGCLLKRSSRYTGAGFVGSLFGVLSAFVLPQDLRRLSAVLAGALLMAVSVSDYVESVLGEHDDPRIVIDEWVGMWFTLAFIPLAWGTLLIGFILFRIFDTLKAPWVRQAARLPGGSGIVMDDVLAGVMANCILRAVLLIHPI
jgi:phosphatidylglycerophosphatase A